jgi:Uma2 family endonuclease
MQAKRQAYFTAKEYLDMERMAPTKSEYYAGEVFAMAGASPNHSEIVANLTYVLVGQLKGRDCHVHPTDLRVHVNKAGLYTYPDVLVVCGRRRYTDSQKDTLLNPTVIFEVISDSTESYDRGRKFAMYRTLESLADYLLINQDESLVEHFTRAPDGSWVLSDHRGLDTAVTIASIDCTLPLADIYDKVEFDADPIPPMLRLVKEPEAEYAAAQRRPGMP